MTANLQKRDFEIKKTVTIYDNANLTLAEDAIT